MSVNVTVVTTANRTCRFSLDTPQGMLALRHALQRGAQLFSGKPLIVGSAQQTEIFAAGAIACIEVDTTNADRAAELAALCPAIGQNPALRKLAQDEAARPFEGGLDGEHFSARLDFFFSGGHTLAMRAEGVRRASLAERLMNLTSLFERPLITYLLPDGGFGLMNPQALARATVTPGVPELPNDALPGTRV